MGVNDWAERHRHKDEWFIREDLLPAYEAAVDALERLVEWNEPLCQRARNEGEHDRPCPVEEAREALARLREKVPA